MALLVCVVGLAGMGLGPQVIGLLSDWLRASYGVRSLRYALLGTTPVLLWAACHFYWAAKTLDGDLRRAASS